MVGFGTRVYSPYTCEISEEAQKTFENSVSKLLGVEYVLVEVSQKLTNGVNYNFYCNTKTISESPVLGAAIVNVYQPLDGKEPVVKSIASISNIFPELELA